MDKNEVLLTDLESRINNLIASQDEVEKTLYRSEEEESIQTTIMERIENGYKALNRRLAYSEKNRWGYSPAGWMSKKLVSKHLNSMKSGLYSIFPIPCKGGQGCPYGESCIAAQYGMEPPIGEPCVIEVTKIENLIVSYSNDFNLQTASTTDRVFLQELIQIDLIMDRCQVMMAQEGKVLQDVTIGITEDGETYTQPVVSRYLDAWERLSKRRQSILNEMNATRKAKKNEKADNFNEEDLLMKMANGNEDFFKVEERPEKYKKKDEE